MKYLTLCILISLSACGVKGPLKLPSEIRDKKKPTAEQTQPSQPDAHREKFNKANSPENAYQPPQPRP